MEISGERYSPQIPVPEISYEHWHRYLYASQFVAGKTVLDIACGEGYGSNFLAQTAERVVGVDISQEAIRHASSIYLRPNLTFEQGRASAVPIEGSAVFDVIVSFETIEHLDEAEQRQFLAEIKRLLKPDGLLLISTPNKLLATDRPDYHNEFHLREFYPGEFRAFLRESFGTVRVLGQHIYPVSYIWPLESSSEPRREYQIAYTNGQYESLATDKKEMLYLVALCSNGDITVPGGSVMLDISDQAISQRIQQIEDKDRHIVNITQQVRDEREARARLEDDIRALHEQLRQAEIHADEIVKAAAYHEQHASDLQQHADQLAQRVADLQSLLEQSSQELEQQSRALEDQQQLLAERNQQLASLQMQMELLQRDIAEMHIGIGYRILIRFRKWCEKALPLGSRRHAVYMKLRRPLSLWLDFGFGYVIRQAVSLPLRAVGLKRTADTVGMGRIPDTVFMRSPDTLYSRWLEANAPSVEELAQQRAAVPYLRFQPLISIITPVYNVEACWLEKCVESVLAQTYPNWELCITDDASTEPHARPLLRELAARDARIKVRYAEKNQGIAATSNQCLDMATGEFVTFLDNDDELAPHALFSIVERLQYAPEIDLIYSDEDKISPQNGREQPYFKPDFSYDLLLSNNYFCHLLVIRRELVERIGRFRTGYDGAQDYDLIMRALEHIEPRNILHIPDVLYHWRIIAGSTATDYNSKPHAVTASLKLLDEHLTRRLGKDYGVVEAVEATPTATVYHVRYALQAQPLVSIIIGTKDKLDILSECIKSLEKTIYPNYEIIIFDNNSQEPTTLSYFEKVTANPRIRVIKYPFPFNYSALNNAGVREAHGDVIVLLNNDTELITPDWLEIMLGLVQQQRVGAVGVQLLYPNNTIQHAGVILGLTGVAGHSHKYYPVSHPGYCNMLKTLRNYSAVTAACLMFRRAVWEEVGGLNEQLAVMFNDIDFCLKIGAAGYDIVYTPQVKLWHHESISVGRVHRQERVMDPREIGYMKGRWASIIAYDPFYNPNLTLDYENYQIQPWRRRPTPDPQVSTNGRTPEPAPLAGI